MVAELLLLDLFNIANLLAFFRLVFVPAFGLKVGVVGALCILPVVLCFVLSFIVDSRAEVMSVFRHENLRL